VHIKNFLRWIARASLAGALVAGLASCGGGGVSSDTGNVGGVFAINPGNGSLYAGIPVSFQVVGGQKPYTITSNEQTVIPLVAYRVDGNSFSVIPGNPGVIDAGLQPEDVPRRTVTLTVRDNRGVQINATYQVIRNFFTGYGIGLVSLDSSCGAACPGVRSRLTLNPLIVDGLLPRNRTLRVSVVTGNFSMVVNQNTGTLGQFVDVVTDESGFATTQLLPALGAPTQFATVRVTDVQSGLYRDHNFTITALSGPLTVLPEEVTIAGPNNITCGSGIASIIVTGGTPPYTATASAPQFITLFPDTLTTNGGTFSVNIAAALPSGCLQDAVVVVRDARGATDTFTINTELGTDPPIVPLSASPSTFCLADGDSANIAVIGGRMGKVVASSNTALATVAPMQATGDFVVTVTAVGAAPVAGQFVTVRIADGTPNVVQIAVRRAPTCT
jgi:hypothetical protein